MCSSVGSRASAWRSSRNVQPSTIVTECWTTAPLTNACSRPCGVVPGWIENSPACMRESAPMTRPYSASSRGCVSRPRAASSRATAVSDCPGWTSTMTGSAADRRAAVPASAGRTARCRRRRARRATSTASSVRRNDLIRRQSRSPRAGGSSLRSARSCSRPRPSRPAGCHARRWSGSIRRRAPGRRACSRR